MYLAKCIFIFYGNVRVFALSSSVSPANLWKQRGKGSGLHSACSVLFAIGPCSIVRLKWRLNAIAIPINFPQQATFSCFFVAPLSRYHFRRTMPHCQVEKKQPGNRPFFKTSVTCSNTITYSDFSKTAISWLLFLIHVLLNEDIIVCHFFVYSNILRI